MNEVIAIIPARYASVRLPAKPLANLGGKPMIRHVVERAQQVVDRIVVATDDERILRVVESFGGEAVMTSDACRSGTDRCQEAFALCGRGEEIIVNLQGDEPFIAPSAIRVLIAAFDDPDTQIATLCTAVNPSTSYEELADPNKPNVIMDSRGYAIYFSRSVLPFVRGADTATWPQEFIYHKHVGIYAFRASVLAEVTMLPPSALELAESLEQLRWIEAGYRIRVLHTDHHAAGIDTPEDLERARLWLSADGYHH